MDYNYIDRSKESHVELIFAKTNIIYQCIFDI